MASKSFKISKGMLFTWLMLAGLICLFLPQSVTGKVHLGFLSLYKFTPALGRSIPLASVATGSAIADNDSKDIQQLRAQYNQLNNHCANLWAELALEHKRLEQTAGLRTRFPALKGAALIPADIITAANAAKGAEIIINRGSEDEVKKDQFVIADNCIIGRIYNTSARTAVVRLVTHKNSAIPVEVAGSKVSRIMKGDGKGSARIKMVPKKYRIDKKAMVYTCNAPGLLDSPMLIGKVTQCKADDDNPLLWDIVVKPATDVESLSGVHVVDMNP